MADWITLAQATQEFKLQESVVLALIGRHKLGVKLNEGEVLVRRTELRQQLAFRPVNHSFARPPSEPARFADVMAEVKFSRRQLWYLISEFELKTWKRAYSRYTWLDLKEVRHFLQHRRLKKPGRKRGGKLAKLSWEDVEAIRQRYAEGSGGISQADLGSEYGVTQNQVSHIVRGEQWKKAS